MKLRHALLLMVLSFVMSISPASPAKAYKVKPHMDCFARVADVSLCQWAPSGEYSIVIWK